MKKIGKILVALALVAVIAMSFVACSSGGSSDKDSSFDGAATLQGILENFQKDEDYIGYKEMFPNTTFEEKIEDNNILLNINGDEGVSGNYEYKLDGDYLTFTYETNGEDYLGISFLTFMQSAASKYLGMEPALVNGYNNGCEVFGIDNKYLINETDEAAGTTTTKVYVAGKYDFKDIDTMYINEKALEYNDALTEDYIGGSVSVGKITAIYRGTKEDATIVFREYGERSDLTYQSMLNVVAKLLPEQADVFAKYYTELKEGEGDGFTITYGLTDELKAEYNLSDEGFEYTVVHFEK